MHGNARLARSIVQWMRHARWHRRARTAGALSLCAIPLAWLWISDGARTVQREDSGSLAVMLAMASRPSTSSSANDAALASVGGEVDTPAAPADPWAEIGPPREGWSGSSGDLTARLVSAGPNGPGLYLLDSVGAPMTEPAVSMLSFAHKRGAYVGSYRMGYWPEELRGRNDAVPAALRQGFLRVTPDEADIYLSAHLQLRDFLVHDDGQDAVWPKYVIVREALVDKLELVLEDLSRHGIRATRLRVLSGFRSPAHNAALRDIGAAAESRHMYGEAADVIIDSDGDGRMDDLNGDWRVDAADVRLVGDAVARVERAHPDLVGGLGLYSAMGPSGPFVHVDVRGRAARWGSAWPWWRARPSRTWSASRAAASGDRASHSVGRCMAEGPSAVLCRGMH